MAEKPPMTGYLRTGVTYQAADWRFDIVSTSPKVAIVTIPTAEGALDVGLNQSEARQLRDRLTQFLEAPSVPSSAN